MIRVLVVDNEQKWRDNITELLAGERDIEVVGVAIEGQEGLDMARTIKPDVVLLEFRVPGLDSITITKTISQELPATKVVIISEWARTREMRRAKMAGSVQWLRKPFKAARLPSVIRQAYEQGAAEREQAALAPAGEQVTARVRVLIVDDSPEACEDIRRWLFFEEDIEVVGTAANGQEAILMVRELRPDVVLMKYKMPVMDGFTATQILSMEMPHLRVIITSTQVDERTRRGAILSGAYELLPKPFTSAELAATIRRVQSATERAVTPSQLISTVLEEEEKVGQILTVYSPKGGVGCSTVAANLAVALQGQGYQTALIDGSFQLGGLGLLLKLRSQRSIVDLIPHITALDEERLQQAMVTHSSGLKVLLAPPRLEMSQQIEAEHVKRVLTLSRKLFAYTVVDTWSSLNDLLLPSFDLADRIVLLILPEISAVNNVQLFLRWAKGLGYPAEKFSLVVNKITPRTEALVEKLEAGLGHPIVGRIPLDEPTAAAAANRGRPFVIDRQESALAQRLLTLANQLTVR